MKKKIHEKQQFGEEREKISSILISKEYFAKELIKNGYIDSYIDFFYFYIICFIFKIFNF